MTRETKLGLVIGGAFIFCFALILSRTDDEAAVGRQVAALLSSTLADPGEAGPIGQSAPPEPLMIPFSGRRRSESIETRSPQPGAGPAQAALRGSETLANEEDPPHLEITPSAKTDSGAGLRQSPPTTTPPPPSTVADAITNRPLPDSLDDGGADSNSPKREDAEVTATDSQIAAVVRSRTQPLVSPPPMPRRVQIYVVSKNDNLTKIARKFYGKSVADKPLGEYVDSIFQANRSTLKNKNSLKVGQKLQIPLRDNRSRNATAETVLAMTQTNRSGRGSTQRDRARTSTGSDWRWYQIRANDRYTKIAKEQLGDEKRWRDIFELNRDVFSNPDFIKPGVRIKLPQ